MTAQKFTKPFLAIIVFLMIFNGLAFSQTSHAALINGITISGTGISNSSSPISTSISPIITFNLPSSLTSTQTLTVILRGTTVINSLNQNEITFGGGCSGSTVLSTNPISVGTNNPILSITGITCSNASSTISISAGNLQTLGTLGFYQIELFSPFDYGITTFYVGGGNQVVITATVNSQITIKVYPEKRIPASGNWINQNIVEIRPVGSTTPLVTQTVQMDVNGDGVMTPVDSSIVPPGTYDFAIKGYSHLRKIYTATIASTDNNFNFTGTNQELLAGDTSVVEDNYINSLDLSQISIKLYSTDIKNDLNRDTEVNSLDLSNMSFNLYLAGSN